MDIFCFCGYSSGPNANVQIHVSVYGQYNLFLPTGGLNLKCVGISSLCLPTTRPQNPGQYDCIFKTKINVTRHSLVI